MSARDRAIGAILTQLALATDGAILGPVLAVVAVGSFIKLTATSSALCSIRDAPSVAVSDIRSILPSDSDGEGGEKLVVVRGTVVAKSAVAGSWKLWPDVLVSQETGEKAVVIQRTQTCIYHGWRGFLGWASDLRDALGRTWKEQESTSTRKVPFILVDDGEQPQADYLIVNLDGSRHALPLTTVFHQMQPINATPYTFLQALVGHEYPVGILDEEKILPIGKDITAVGICNVKSGVPEIKSCSDLPYFLSNLSKDQMLEELTFKTKILFWSGCICGSLSIGILGYAIVRNWRRFKEWREQRRAQQQRLASSSAADPLIEEEEDEDVNSIPDGQLCVICLLRRRRSAFVPCGHLVCCQSCALSVERELSPKCPVCRQTIRNSVRIYDS